MDENEYIVLRHPEPTDAEPGSPEKIEILRQRWAGRYEMHHAEDKRATAPEWSKYYLLIHRTDSEPGLRTYKTGYYGRGTYYIGRAS